MSENNKSYRIRVTPGDNTNVHVQLNQDYDTFEILSLKLNSEGDYNLHNSEYGVIAGRVQSGNFGIPNAKVSVFIESDRMDDVILRQLYPYSTTQDKGVEDVRYNLLPDTKVDNCHQVVGTFPNKRFLLDNDVLLEVFDKYYKYTTRTNNAGDYMICGVPVGAQTVHMDLDLSDCGILSQRPRDFVYKGYTIEQFENPNMFKTGKEIDTLSQIFSQDLAVDVIPFWGNSDSGAEIGITRADITIPFKFEPTCVFIGCVVSDTASNGVSKKCIPTEGMGEMDELVTGNGTIEMIRKTPTGGVEEFQIKGNELINSDGVWCYQIPMNLDYMMTDEYGNMVPTNDPEKGIPTRTRVRFRISMEDLEENTDNYFRAKVLVPNNPKSNGRVYDPVKNTGGTDYNFGSLTIDDSFRDLFWNGVYSVKSYIPRFQKSQNYKDTKFTGIKSCNVHGQNNPMPYNNIRIKLPLMYVIMCVLIKVYIMIVSLLNSTLFYLSVALSKIGASTTWFGGGAVLDWVNKLKFSVIYEGLCPDMENWYFVPMLVPKSIFISGILPEAFHGETDRWLALNGWRVNGFGDVQENGKYPEDDAPKTRFNLMGNTYNSIVDNGELSRDFEGELDTKSIDSTNKSESDEAICLTTKTDYLISCIEMNLAQEHKVINFDFYNDWINGMIYIPRWMRFVRPKRSYLFGLIKIDERIDGCMNLDSEGRAVSFGRSRRYTQQCYLKYNLRRNTTPEIKTSNGCVPGSNKMECHKKDGVGQVQIFGRNGGIVQEKKTMQNQYVYYFKPKEETEEEQSQTVNLFATDIILLGTLNTNDRNGIPQAFKYLSSTSYKMPTNLALTNMDTNGYLYMTDEGTICKGNHRMDDRGIKTNAEKQSFAQEEKFYSGTTNSIKFGALDDYIPLTEAAGIAWNYSGPGQGDIVKDVMYQPGGHFLGLSCINSETNIKSCINLERVCELGTTISQRHEEVIGYDENTNKLKYRNFVPTGLINKIDINGSDFRTMFATMNHNKLIATRIDPQTNYPQYEFSYFYANGFSGELYSKIKDRDNQPYNQSMSEYTIDESNRDPDIKNMDDYDPTISAETYTRTIEEQTVDYYMFRMGLNSTEVDAQKEKYGVVTDDNFFGLPQYENSFYFYFGLRDGATAIDEFNKQFFSNCGDGNLDAEE